MISSLEALRKITKPTSSSTSPIEGFQKYLEVRKRPVFRSSYSSFKKGQSLSKIHSISNKKDSEMKTKYLYLWKFEAIRPHLPSDKSFISSQIHQIISQALLILRSFHLHLQAKYFFYLKSTTSSAYPLLQTLKKLTSARLLPTFHKLSLVHRERTRLIYFVIQNLLRIIRNKFKRWKLNADKVQLELRINNRLAVLDFKEFQNLKLVEVIMNYRKARQVALKKGFYLWKVMKKGVEEEVEEVKDEGEEKVSAKRLARAKEVHENAVVESEIKLRLIEMIMKIFNVE